jgi:short-subunit dehydrogenase
MSHQDGRFRERYGPWAVVAGASMGLGEAFARYIASRGVNLCLVARRTATLDALAGEIRSRHDIQVRSLPLDLAAPGSPAELADQVGDLDVGLLVYNAAFSLIGRFFETPVDAHLQEIDVNCRAPMELAWLLGRRMRTRARGGIVLMSSLSASQGSALIANYAATKAFNLVLAEGLWYELRAQGIDVLATCAGATATPNYRARTPPGSDRGVPVMEPDAVVAETFGSLGRRPSLVPGWRNRVAAFVMRRLLPRQAAVRIMGDTMQAMYGPAAPMRGPSR